MADNMEVDESTKEEGRQVEAQSEEEPEEPSPSAQSEIPKSTEGESDERTEVEAKKGDRRATTATTAEPNPSGPKEQFDKDEENKRERANPASGEGKENEPSNEKNDSKREIMQRVDKESPPKAAQPVYRRKPKKRAHIEEDPKAPTTASLADTEPEDKKSESVKKRKPGFQKKDKAQEDVALVKKEGQFEIGDLVWTKLKGHPWWPSQVFDPEKASKKAKRLEKPGHLLIAFFGDETFAWHRPEDLVPYEDNFESKSQQQGGGKVFQRAIEGAQEELERQKAAAQGIIIEDPEEREERLQRERAIAEKEAIAAYDPERILHYIRALAADPLDGPSDEPSRIQALAYRSVTFHEEKEHPTKAGVLPGWRPILKEPKRKVEAARQEDSDEDVPILASPRISKVAKVLNGTKPTAELEGSPLEKKKRGWPKGKPRGKKTAVDGAGEDAPLKKRRRKRKESAEGGGTKFDQLVAAIDDIEGRTNDSEQSLERNEAEVSKRELKNGEDRSMPERKEGDMVHIPAPKVKRASREEAGEELGALLDKLRLIAQDPLASEPDSSTFADTQFFEYRRYQIGRSRLRYQRAFNHPIAASPKHSLPEKRKALDGLSKVNTEGGQIRRRNDAPAAKTEGEESEKTKVKRIRKRKERFDDQESGQRVKKERKEKVKREKRERIKEDEIAKKEDKEETESSDEDVPLHKRMKVSPAESALPPRKQVGTSTAAERIAENRRRMLGVKGASERKEASERDKKASERDSKASETPAKPFEPLAVFMRFPERFAVPSEAQLKASFVRFGELATYYGATRVLPHKSAAQVVFKSSDDAQRAFNYCRKNEMFGSSKIRYELREVVLQDVARRGRLNGGESVFNKLTYDELLKGPTQAPSYRPINSWPPDPVFLGAPLAAKASGSVGGPKSILKDPRRIMQEALLKPTPLQPPSPASALPAYASPRGAPEPPPYPPQPPAYAPQASSYAGQRSAYANQPVPYRPAQPGGSAPAYGPRPPAYGPNQSQPPAYAPRPGAYGAFSQPSTAAYKPAPPLPPYPRGQQLAPPPPPYGQPPAVGGQFVGQTLPPPPPPMPPQLSSIEMQQLASVLNAFPMQNSLNSQSAQLLPPPPPPMPPQDPRRQGGGENQQEVVSDQGEPADLSEAGGSHTAEATGGPGPEESDQFRDMLEQLLHKAAEIGKALT